MNRIGPVVERLEAACAGDVATAAACVVLRGGERVHQSAHGRLSDAPGAEPADLGTVFDIASVTKVMSTTAVAMTLHAEGRLDLDLRASEALAGAPDVAVRDLLLHRAGLPAWRPLWEQARALAPSLFGPPDARPTGEARRRAVSVARAAVLEAVLAEPPERAPREAAVYSDLGFILLGRVLEEVGGAALADLFRARIAEPLGLPAARFVDEAAAEPRPAPAAATRRAPSRGGTLLFGEVDDDNAYALGGAAGHAGLFATADEVARFGEAVRAAHAGDDRGPFAPETVRLFLTRDVETPGSTRALGWDTPAASGSAAGERLSRRDGFGHLGYTGCSLWLDLSRGLTVVLLTNRVHCSEAPEPIRRLRADLHDLVIDHLEDR